MTAPAAGVGVLVPHGAPVGGRISCLQPQGIGVLYAPDTK